MPRREARRAVAANPSRMRFMSWRSSMRGATSPSAWASGDGASVSQPRGESGATWWPPRHGGSLEALRPAWAIWMQKGTGA